MPAPSAIGSTHAPSARESTAAPPANANASGAKPTIRRACESETTSEKVLKKGGTSVSSATITVPPRTNAAQRRCLAKAASGTQISAATATTPVRANAPDASR